MSRFRTLRHQQGVAAVEFAFLLPLLLVMIFGTTELGRAIYTYNTLGKAVRDAARHLSQHDLSSAATLAEARCLAAYGNLACQNPALAPGLTKDSVKTSDVVQTCSEGICPLDGAIRVVTVSIEGYSYNSVIDHVIPDLKFGNISITMRVPL